MLSNLTFEKHFREIYDQNNVFPREAWSWPTSEVVETNTLHLDRGIGGSAIGGRSQEMSFPNSERFASLLAGKQEHLSSAPYSLLSSRTLDAGGASGNDWYQRARGGHSIGVYLWRRLHLDGFQAGNHDVLQAGDVRHAYHLRRLADVATYRCLPAQPTVTAIMVVVMREAVQRCPQVCQISEGATRKQLAFQGFDERSAFPLPSG